MALTLRSFLSLIAISLTTFSAFIFITFLFCVVKPLSTRFYRVIVCRYAFTAWIDVVRLILPPTRIVLTEESELPGSIGPAIIVANHQTFADWWWAMMIATCCGMQGFVKVIIPEKLQKIPLIGLILKMLEFPCLGSCWKSSRKHLRLELQSLSSKNLPFLLVLFPEGARYNSKNLQKSIEYAKKEKRPILRNVLLPRNKGFHACLDATRESSPAVYDLTMVFSPPHQIINLRTDNSFQSSSNLQSNGDDHSVSQITKSTDKSSSREFDQKKENLNPNPSINQREDNEIIHSANDDHESAFFYLVRLLGGHGPKEIYVKIKRYSFEDVLSTTQWLDTKWVEKDQTMKHLIRHQQQQTQQHQTRNNFIRFREFNTRDNHIESAVSSLIWLIAVPFVIPLIVISCAPLVIIAVLFLILTTTKKNLRNRLIISNKEESDDDNAQLSTSRRRQESLSEQQTPSTIFSHSVPLTPFSSPVPMNQTTFIQQNSGGTINGREKAMEVISEQY